MATNDRSAATDFLNNEQPVGPLGLTDQDLEWCIGGSVYHDVPSPGCVSFTLSKAIITNDATLPTPPPTVNG